MLQVKNIWFGYGNKPTLKNISFNVAAGEHLSIIGESGSGKSTLIKLLYGEYDLNQGSIFWKNTQILGPAYNLVIGYDFIKYVAQEFDLMPFTTVAENIGDFLSNFYPEEKQKRVNELLKVVELTHLANTKVKLLSGGQKQRVALARAIAKQPEIILLDEPFSHIDNFKKQTLRRSFFKYLKEQNIACIVATHDKNDVLPFADNMIVLSNNEVVANNTPQNLYNNPKTPLIASFFDEFNHIEPFGLVYAHQIKIVEHSNLKATVKHSYYNGNHYLIEAILNDKLVLFKHENSIENDTTVYLKVVKLN
ncbi:ABC transporter ATP-binding protein [Seonamhaeicola algicola]|uniref:ABC transporter ATP-binding protein n=1 Tax=Seonamhaeicola algicola TaxID=1719036 RepID=A0A5C7AWP3_9FLAO|nr:ABC transporter ATP-binding protein [Seonamhaeicola algicola]TXE12911.1 ABC transporter ATP-binding protein [Seonamhaeicola algicola]